MSTVSEELVRVAKARLVELDHEASLLRAVVSVHSAAEIQPVREVAAEQKEQSDVRVSTPHGGRGLSPVWAAVLRHVGEKKGRGANYADLLAFGTSHGFNLKHNVLRGQMANYKKRKWVRSPRPGVFVLTNLGQERLAENKDGAGDRAPAPSQSFSGRTEAGSLEGSHSDLASPQPRDGGGGEGVLANTG